MQYISSLLGKRQSPEAGVTADGNADDVAGELPSDACCYVCSKSAVTDDNDMAQCDGCQRSFHAKCLRPHYEGIPSQLPRFFCLTCFAPDTDVEFVIGHGKKAMVMRGRVKKDDLPTDKEHHWVQVIVNSDAAKDVAYRMRSYPLRKCGALQRRDGAFRILPEPA